MVQRKKINLSRNSEKSVLDQLLDIWGLNYISFARLIGVNHKRLWDYRKGNRGLRLSTSQIKALDKLLRQAGLRFEDLPDDWILDRQLERELVGSVRE